MTLEAISDPPTLEEMKQRLARVAAAMDGAKLDYYVVCSPDNVYYLTNFANYVHERPFVLVISKAGAVHFVVPKLEIPHVKSRLIGAVELVSYAEFPAPAGHTWADCFRPLFKANARVGVESICPLQVYAEIPGDRVRADVVDDVRMVKSKYEIGRMTYAANLATEAHNQLMAEARPGRTLAEVMAQYGAMMSRQVYQDNPHANPLATRFIAVFQSAEIAHDPHNFSDIHLQMSRGGPHVSIINGIANGYGTEVERTWFLGAAPEAVRKPFETMLEARRTAYERARPGESMSEVDRAVNDVFRRAGYEEYMLHRTGHSLGVTGHEAPFLAEGYDREIEPGMVFTIEPGIYIPGVGGFRHSDSVLITQTGNRALTGGVDQLDDVTLPLA